SGGETFDIYKDSESSPFASINAKNTGGNLYFETLESPAVQLNGLHKISVKFNGNSSFLNSMGFVVTPSSGVDDKATIDSKHIVYANQGNVVVGLLADGDIVSIYDGRGVKIFNTTA